MITNQKAAAPFCVAAFLYTSVLMKTFRLKYSNGYMVASLLYEPKAGTTYEAAWALAPFILIQLWASPTIFLASTKSFFQQLIAQNGVFN